MSEQKEEQEVTDVFVPERPVTITLHLSPADVELALTSGGCSLCGPAIRALVLARVFDVDDLECTATGPGAIKPAA